ncbi:MAG: MerR family transcriptional regulator [Bacteriovoracaceae bacterium]
MIPNKSNFKFQELTPITGVKPYVIRFWETEFPEIAPVMGDSGQKLYARKDVETILRIKKLLFEEKLTIPEAKIQLQSEESVALSPAAVSRASVRDTIQEALDFIRHIKFMRKW